VLRTFGLLFAAMGALAATASTIVVIGPGTVGVRHAFGHVDRTPLMPGIRFVTPWSSVERFSTREEQYPESGDEVEEIAALSSEQMGMTVDVALRWQIDPQEAPRIFTEIGNEVQIHQAVRNAIRNGVRDGMVQFTINDIAQRNRIAAVMESEVDSALVTRPRGGGAPFRIATVTAFFLRDLQPPAQVIAAINAKIAQEQQIQTERHRVEVARLQAEQQRLLNITLTPEALAKQYIEVLHEMRNSNNTVILVPTEGGLPLLDIAALRRNLRGQ
jgi:regulator of protease activity HflC (stomatin/prohibitin superfamily)